MTLLGFDHIKEMYRDDPYFKEIYEPCENPISRDRGPWTKYILQEGLLFRGNQLCIPRCSMRGNLLVSEDQQFSEVLLILGN